MPSQLNGYVKSCSAITPSGNAGRQMPWKPSQPAMKSQTSSSPLYVIRGRSLSRSCTATSSTSKWIGTPRSSSAAISSLTTSCCP